MGEREQTGDGARKERVKVFRWGFASASGMVLALVVAGQAVGVMLAGFGVGGMQARDWIFCAFLASACWLCFLQRHAIWRFLRSVQVGVTLVALTTLAVIVGVLVPQIEGFEDPEQRVTAANYEDQYAAFRWAEGYFLYHVLSRAAWTCSPALVATSSFGLFVLLGGELTVARLVTALVVALGAAWLVGRLVPPSEAAQATAETGQAPAPLGARLREGMIYGLGELVDHTAPWILVGLGVAAAAAPLLDAELLSSVPAALQVPLFALLGVPLYVCASGATPLAAVAIYNGISPGAALAFLLTGPATNTTTFGVMRRLHGGRVTGVFAVAVGGLAVASGWCVDALLFERLAAVAEEAHHHAPSTLEVASLVGLGALFAASLWRQGPRGALGQILDPIDAHGAPE